jgi:hypothetical protein
MRTYLSHLAAAASTQNVALSALLFLYRQVQRLTYWKPKTANVPGSLGSSRNEGTGLDHLPEPAVCRRVAAV